MSIYDKEILEFKKEIIFELINELKSIKNFKIRANMYIPINLILIPKTFDQLQNLQL
ncbi:hypothetical protein L5F68_05580 [Aliarcobacter butzleri]|uniref:hypothetical protein n=1 Tax=Aliarcobacter butzleri TaxID=28197 RepID=UPI001EDF8D70|nr:hypothetical protein [Aliarcobacter butzleri]MCG3703802.1 hypothetical protein [Aliarcobacter butzleri]